MRIVVFFAYLCFHLLCGGSSLYAPSTHTDFSDSLKTNYFIKNHQLNLPNLDHERPLIEYVDLDIDEEYTSGDDSNIRTAHKFLLGKYNLIHNLYSTNSRLLFLNYFQKPIKTLTCFCGLTSPIYILQSVLRI